MCKYVSGIYLTVFGSESAKFILSKLLGTTQLRTRIMVKYFERGE